MKKTFFVAFILILMSGLVFSQAVLKKQTKPTITVKPKITVLSPNGGETWRYGQSHQIRWSSVGVKGKVRIYVMGKKGGKTYNIGFSITKDVSVGSVNFSIPANLMGIYKARAHVDQVVGSVKDVSDADFTVFGKIKIIPVVLKSIRITVPPKKAPGQRVTYYRNGRYAVMWKTTGKINKIGIKLVWKYKDEPPLVYHLASGVPNNGRYDIVITPNIPAIQYYHMIVYDTANPKINDTRGVDIKIQ